MAAKYPALQSRAARLIRGDALRSVRHCPSRPLANAPLEVAINLALPVSTEIVVPFPAAPMVRAVIVRTAPVALAQTPVAPPLISSSKHFAIDAAVSPIKFV